MQVMAPKLFLIFSGFMLFIAASSQNKDLQKPGGQISGTILDSASGKGIESATINFYEKGIRKAVTGALTDQSGLFTVDKLPQGIYSIIIQFIGYKTIKLNNIVLKGTDLNLGNLKMAYQNNQSLQEVTVVAKAAVIENKVDKIVYNVANDITSQGGVALDVLKKVPQVTVDIDGNVELQGNSSIKFLINGKPSTAFGNSITDALAAIPASQIKSIEAITSPGAKYDAEGTGGIINIILKDNKMKGVNGTLNLSAGTRLENGSFNLNIRNGNFGVNGFFNGNTQLNSRTLTSQDRYSVDSTAQNISHLLLSGYSDFVRYSYQTGVGFDWSLNKKESVTGSLGYFHFGNHSKAVIGQEQETSDFSHTVLSDLFSSRNSNSNFDAGNVEWSLNYKKTFAKEKQEFNVLISSSYGTNLVDYQQNQTYTGQSTPFNGSTSHNPGTDRQTDMSVDYAHPVSENFLLETGAKMIVNDITSTADVHTLSTLNNQYYPDTTQSYHLNYDRKIYAGYLSASFPLFHFINVKTGLRFEHTDTKIDFPNTYIPAYNSWVPSAMFIHELKNKQSIKFAYSHRIERPEYRELNPFKNLSDPYNISTGNPQLQPELGDNFELGYNKSFEKGGSIYLALVNRINSQDIKPYTYFYPTYKIGDSVYNNVSVTSRVNIGKEVRSGLVISLSLPVKDKWNFRLNTFLSNRHIVNNLNGGSTTNGFDGRINLNITYQLPRNLIMEAFVNYNSSVNNVQGKMPQYFSYTYAFRKQFLNKKASFGFTTTNPFNEYVNQLITTTTANYISTAIRHVPLRSFGISIQYKFGKLQFKKEKEKEDSPNPSAPTDM